MREAAHLRERYRTMLVHVALIAAFVGLLLLAPLAVVFTDSMDWRTAACFAIPGLGLALVGFCIWRAAGTVQAVLTLQEGGVIVMASWVIASLAGAIPLAVIEHLSVSQAVFESVSGWTTTGLSVIDVTRAHPATLLWRSTMQLAGGAGLAILTLAAVTSPGGMSLSVAEGRTDQLAPNVRNSALLVVRIYAAYVLLGILALRAAGMGWFDAVNHSFCAVSTGGFSTRTDSIGAFDSPLVEGVTMVLMILGGLNFLTSWCLLRGRLAAVARNGEVRLQALLVPIAAGLVLVVTCLSLYAPATKAVRVAIFETVSALTTTGFSTVGYRNWNGFGILMLIVLMLIGSGTCSTGGAIKQQRIYLLYRLLVRELRRPFRPRAAIAEEYVWLGEERTAVTDAHARALAVFVFVYVATWLFGAAVLTAHGYPLQDALFEYASTLGTVGLSIGITGPDTPPVILWTQTAGMLLGRLEFFVIFASTGKLVLDSRRMARLRP
ncbi:MAG TPA: TrkH family potassium uptake protein [Planctomycetota bacterium]|nr:TrkH family potassium uptake protein [Planctomycetota bacterium]